MLSRPGDLEDAALRSNAYLSAYSPILTGTTVYSPSPVLTNLGKPSRAGSFSERGHPEKSIPLSANDFEVLRCLGQGSYGQVFLVRHVTTAQLLAMKVIDNRRLPFEKYGRIFEEQRIGKTLADSRWSLGIEGSFHDSNNFYLLFVSDQILCHYPMSCTNLCTEILYQRRSPPCHLGRSKLLCSTPF